MVEHLAEHLVILHLVQNVHDNVCNHDPWEVGRPARPDDIRAFELSLGAVLLHIRSSAVNHGLIISLSLGIHGRSEDGGRQGVELRVPLFREGIDVCKPQRFPCRACQS